MKTIFTYSVSVFLLVLAGCQKDPYLGGAVGTRQPLDLNETRPSFIEYGDKTFEIPIEVIKNEISEKTDFSITFQSSDPILDSLKAGSIIVSPRYTSFEHMLMRKIISVEKQGNVVRLITEPAEIHEAYSSWHFDTRDGFFLNNKRNADILDLSYLNTVISNATFIDAIKSALESRIKQAIHNDLTLELSVSPNISGSLDFVYGDINAEYLSILQEGSTSPIDSDDDGVIDIVEINLGTDPGNAESYPASSGIRMSNFSMDAEFQTTISYEQSIETKDLDYNFNNYDATEKDQLFSELDSTINAKISNYPGFSQIASIIKNEYLPEIDKSPATYRYFPTPATIGAATVTLVLSPYLNISGKLVGGVATKLSNMDDPFTMDIVFGDTPLDTEVTYYRTSGQTNADLSENTFTVPYTGNLYELFSLDVLAFAEGELEFTFGFAFGAALSFGEANSAGWNIGFALIPNCGPKITGKAITMPLNVISEWNGGTPLTTAIYNNSRIEACLDINAYLLLKVFNDVNDPFTQDLLDVGLVFNTDPIFKFSDVTNTSICIPEPCSDVDFSKIDVSLLQTSIQINNQNRNNLSKYDLKVSDKLNGTLLLESADLDFSTDHSIQFDNEKNLSNDEFSSYVLVEIFEKSTDNQRCPYDPLTLINPFRAPCQFGSEFANFFGSNFISCRALIVDDFTTLDGASVLSSNDVVYVQQAANTGICSGLNALPITKQLLDNYLISDNFNSYAFANLFQATGYYADVTEQADVIFLHELVEPDKAYIWTAQEGVALEVDPVLFTVEEKNVPKTTRIPCRCIR